MNLVRLSIAIFFISLSISILSERAAITDIIGAIVRDNGSFIEPSSDGDGFQVNDPTGADTSTWKHDGTDTIFSTSTGVSKFNAGIDVTGNIVVSGTVDGKDIAANACMLNEAETIAANWVNTANPWAVNEIDASVIIDTEIDTEAELETVSNITNIIRETEIDTSSELRAIVAGTTGTGDLCFATSPTFAVSTTVVNEAQSASMTGISYSDTAGHRANVKLRRARGTAASPTAVQANDDIGQIMFEGWDTSFSLGAAIKATADAEWGTSGDTTDNPTRLTFLTTPDGSGTNTERMRIDMDGNVGIGVNAPTDTLDINGELRLRVQLISIADSGDGNPATLVLEPTHSYIQCACSDTDSCDITMSETNANPGQIIFIYTSSGGAGETCDFADSGGVLEVAGGVTASLGFMDSLMLLYTSERWIEISRSDN